MSNTQHRKLVRECIANTATTTALHGIWAENLTPKERIRFLKSLRTFLEEVEVTIEVDCEDFEYYNRANPKPEVLEAMSYAWYAAAGFFDGLAALKKLGPVKFKFLRASRH